MAPPEPTPTPRVLESYCQQWRTLTASEGDAIRDGRWPEVQRLQDAKRQLQDFIRAAIRALSPVQRERINAELRPLIEELICLEDRNRERLATQRQRLVVQRQQTDAAAQNLRQVRAAYSPPPSAVWHSYS